MNNGTLKCVKIDGLGGINHNPNGFDVELRDLDAPGFDSTWMYIDLKSSFRPQVFHGFSCNGVNVCNLMVRWFVCDRG